LVKSERIGCDTCPTDRQVFYFSDFVYNFR
jgi:hypothetical protein